MPLGALQLQGEALKDQLKPQPAAPVEKHSGEHKIIEPTGIPGIPIREWLCGHISGALCLARVLDGVQLGRFSNVKKAKELSGTQDLYCASTAVGYWAIEY